MPEIQFGSLKAANRVREDRMLSGFVNEDADNAASKTVVIQDDTPESALEEIQGEAAESREHKAEEHGQVPLTDAEKKRIDFSETNIPAARAVKGIARGKGVDDWTSYFDEQATVDDHRTLMEEALTDERGRRGLGKDEENDDVVDQKFASAYQTQQRESLGKAKEYAFGGDQDAQEEVRSQGPLSDVIGISFSRTETGGMRGSGEDYARLEEIHESRSSRAQTLDEKKSAQVTRDPFQWVNNKDKYDYPGIDTVDPEELHSERSEQAQARDERSAAPLTENKQQWALNPGRYDYAGVDDVDPEKLHAARSKRAREQDEDELAPIADTKQQWAQSPGRYDWRGVDTPSEDLTFVDGDGSNGSSGDGMEFFREIDGERTPASTVLEDRPRSETRDAPGLAPEDFEDFGIETEEDVERRTRQSNAATKASLAGGEEADLAFINAEQQRKVVGMSGFMDDRPESDELTSFGMDADVRDSQGQESRADVESASEFGVDDRSDDAFEEDSGDGGDQRGFEEFGGGVRENETLF